MTETPPEADPSEHAVPPDEFQFILGMTATCDSGSQSVKVTDEGPGPAPPEVIPVPYPVTFDATVRVFAAHGHPGGTRPATLIVHEWYKCGPDGLGWINAVDSEPKGKFTWVPDQRCGPRPPERSDAHDRRDRRRAGCVHSRAALRHHRS